VGNVRGVDLVDAQAFVRECYGVEAPGRVLAALDTATRELLAGRVREVGWYPLSALVSYLTTARRVLDPDAADFFRRQGFDAAMRRRSGPLASMISSRQLRMRLVRVVWRLFYDVGRVEVTGDRPEATTTRIHDFPASPELCERFQGIWEGMASGPEGRARAEELRCVLHGDPFCELRVSYEPGVTQ
jgi:hypothetical protein